MPTSTATVASPCIDICRIDPVSGWCEGCLRTLDEIAEWSGLDDLARQAVWERLPARRATAQPGRSSVTGAGGPAIRP